jgi:ribonuclease Z
MNFEVTILGSNSAIPTANKFPSSQLVTVNHHYYLIDCGEGTQMQLRKYGIKFQRIEAIFISHLHGDHFFGLIGLLMTMQLLGRTKPLTIYSHIGLKEIIELQFKVSGGRINFPLTFVDLARNQEGVILSDKNVEIKTFPLDHRISCNGFVIKEQEKPKTLVKELCDEYEISIAEYQNIKAGNDVVNIHGKMILNNLVTRNPSRARSYAYCSDTCYFEQIIEHIKGVDLLYHEATFADDMLVRAKQTKHSTGRQAATIAKLAKVKKMLIGHFSVRYENVSLILEEAREIFENVSVAKEGDKHHITI